MKKKIVLLFFFLVFLISLTSAAQENLGTFKQNDCIDLTQTCTSCTYNNITSIIYPNGTKYSFIPEQNMTKLGTEYLFNTCNFSLQAGGYIVNGYGDLSGTDTIWNYGYEITHSGGSIKEGSASVLSIAILFMLIVGTVFFIGFLRKEQKFQTKWTLFLLSFIFFLTGANLISALIGDTLANPLVVSFFDGFMAIAFLLFWFAFGLLIIMWILTTIQTLLLKNLKRKAEKFE